MASSPSPAALTAAPSSPNTLAAVTPRAPAMVLLEEDSEHYKDLGSVPMLTAQRALMAGVQMAPMADLKGSSRSCITYDLMATLEMIKRILQTTLLARDISSIVFDVFLATATSVLLSFMSLLCCSLALRSVIVLHVWTPRTSPAWGLSLS